jgi:hypothetical protein
VTATNPLSSDAIESGPSESGISRTAELRERGNTALSEARVLARYSGRDEELTKPSVMLLDWCGDDEVTVRWDATRHGLAPTAAAPELDELDELDDNPFAPRRFRGIGARAGSVLLGLVLGVAVTIGVLALFAPRSGPDQPNASGATTEPAGVDIVSLRP